MDGPSPVGERSKGPFIMGEWKERNQEEGGKPRGNREEMQSRSARVRVGQRRVNGGGC